MNDNEDKVEAHNHFHYHLQPVHVLNQIGEVVKVESQEAETDIYVDAMRWRALMSSARMQYMGSSGFQIVPKQLGTKELQSCEPQPHPMGCLHFGMEFWSDFTVSDLKQLDPFERSMMIAYVDEIRRRRGLTKESGSPNMPEANQPLSEGSIMSELSSLR